MTNHLNRNHPHGTSVDAPASGPPGDAPPTIEAVGLTKRFGETAALDSLDVTCERGQVTALLGPNGAGKTTFVRMVATLTRPDGGVLRVDGIDVASEPERVRRLIGLAGQSASVEPALTGRENLNMVARLFGHRPAAAAAAAEQVLHDVDLTDDGDRLVREYSGGMRRRLDLAASLVGAPRVLLLDEPTTGLDPRTRLMLWSSIRELVARGTDVLLTTQYLEEADQLADRVVIIDHGRVVAKGTPDELKHLAGHDVIDLTVPDTTDIDAVRRIADGVGAEPARVDADSRTVRCPVIEGTAALSILLAELTAHGLTFDDVALRRPTLDDVFLTLTGASR